MKTVTVSCIVMAQAFTSLPFIRHAIVISISRGSSTLQERPSAYVILRVDDACRTSVISTFARCSATFTLVRGSSVCCLCYDAAVYGIAFR